MFKQLPWRRTFEELLLRGAISLIICAVVAVAVGGILSVVAESFGPKPQTSNPDQAGACKAGKCVVKRKGAVLGRVRTARE
jgi:hypothetical protein